MNNLMKLKEKKSMNLNKNEKGFTLIEMVIVLVIIAILAAILVPSMIGWIENAKKKSLVSEATSVFTAVQSEIGNVYTDGATGVDTTAKLVAADPDFWKNVSEAVGNKYTPDQLSGGMCEITFEASSNCKISSFKYTSGGYSTTYTASNGKWSPAAK